MFKSGSSFTINNMFRQTVPGIYITTYKWTGTAIHITMLFYDSQWIATVMDNITVNGVEEGTCINVNKTM